MDNNEMSVKIMGYKGATKLTAEQQEDFNALTEITKYLSGDIVGETLLNWYTKLSMASGTDTAMFYCPYIPLQEMTFQAIADELGKSIQQQVDKDIIESLLGQVKQSVAIPKYLLDPKSTGKVEPDANFNDNDPWIIGVKNELYTPPFTDIISSGKPGWDLILSQN